MIAAADLINRICVSCSGAYWDTFKFGPHVPCCRFCRWLQRLKATEDIPPLEPQLGDDMVGDLTPGVRRDQRPEDPDNQWLFPILRPGEYGKRRDGVWCGCLPVPPDVDGFTTVCDWSRHTVEEHPDGTISVTPSTLVTGHRGSWHGYIEHGVWREV